MCPSTPTRTQNKTCIRTNICRLDLRSRERFRTSHNELSFEVAFVRFGASCYSITPADSAFTSPSRNFRYSSPLIVVSPSSSTSGCHGQYPYETDGHFTRVLHPLLVTLIDRKHPSHSANGACATASQKFFGW